MLIRFILLCAILLAAPSTWAATAFVQAASSSDAFTGGATSTVSFGSNTTGGNAVVCWVYWSSQTISLTSVGNGPDTATLYDNNTNVAAAGRAAFALIHNVTAAANTITATFSSTLDFSVAVSMYCHEVSGVPISAALDTRAMNIQSVAPGTGADAVTSGSITTTQNGDYIFGATKDYSIAGAVMTNGTGFTTRSSGSNGAMSESAVQATAGSIAATFTTSLAFSLHVTGVLALKDSAIGGGGPPVGGGGNTITASSCLKADVDTAINLAVDGDIVQLPACASTTWTTPVSTSKGITIKGAGAGSTTINNNGFDMFAPDGKSWRITAMTLTGTACINHFSSSKSFRIDHITFNAVAPGAGRCQNRIIWIQPTGPAYTKGVIDHNTFTNPGAIQIHVRYAGDGGNGEYIRALGLGTDDSVFIEDNTFSHATLNISNPVTDCDGGGRMTFRYNTVINSYFEMHDAIVGSLRSCRKWEVYNNNFSMTYESGQFVFVGIRGGTGVVHDNVYNTNGFFMGSPLVVGLYRLAQTGGDPWDALCSLSSGKATLASTTPPSGCTGTANGCVNLDGPGTGGYPCRDQFGFDGNDPQISRPVLLWNNLKNGVQTNGFAFNGPSSPASHIVENTDWCRSNTATPPATCNGVATTYTDYTYPHPLQSGFTPPGSSPRRRPPPFFFTENEGMFDISGLLLSLR